MPFYKVRVHESESVSRDKISAYFAKFDGGVYIVRETDAARSHFQGIVYTERTTRTVRDNLKDAFGLSGNKDISVGVVNDYAASVRYYSKGARDKMPDVVCMCALDIDVKKAWTEYWKENERLKKKAKDEGARPIIEQVYEVFKGQKRVDRREVGQELLRVLKERNRGIQMNGAKGYFNAIMMRLDTGFEEDFLTEMISRSW